MSKESSIKPFSEQLAALPAAEHVQKIELIALDGETTAVIENKPGSQGSIKVYHHLYKKYGEISVEAANEGLGIYAEHTEDAKLNAGKHPNIDRLLALIENNSSLAVKLYDHAGLLRA
ncbi:DUF2322 family protein [Methyloradius palustris]|uniref:DUF2322 family protein n=1 Tax=Methyloradius palustris TaxID=2778876 RepID=A0A8D5G9H2_9PROT|nr:DUF2322 family protein [Methyloradius palustris]BCM24091.1 hypothetical protein ZMTM_03500 [Methyloradius palustris]